MSAQFPTVFVFSPTGRSLGAKGTPSPSLAARWARGASSSLGPAPLRVYAPKATFPMFPPWALWIPVKSADFLPVDVDVAGSQIQETKRHRDTQHSTGWRPPSLPPCVSLTEHETQDQGA